MSKLSVTLVIKDYDYIAPLACGDVVAQDLDLKLDRDTPGALDRTLSDSSIMVGELSFARHLSRLSNDDGSFVGIPSFPYRAFRQRCFFVHRDSALKDFADLAGKRIGTNEWPATGNTWSRAILREAGVRIEGISWVVGSIDGGPSARSQGDLPPHVKENASSQSLRDQLISGELDALMCPLPPKGFYEPGSPIVRLVPDFRKSEQDYYRRTGIFPAHHIVGIRRELFEREPWVAHAVFDALERSKLHWQASRRRLAETTPWLLADLEDCTAMIGDDWSPDGVEPNRKMTQLLCDELLSLGLLAKPLDEATVFAEFEAVTPA
jgi:4,5-dihydroxyphthalate decarboxylase